MNERTKSFLKEKVGISGLIIIILVVVVLAWGRIQAYQLSTNSISVKGIITRIDTASRGAMYWKYYFMAKNEKFTGSCPVLQYPHLHVGDTIVIQYERNNPNNNGIKD